MTATSKRRSMYMKNRKKLAVLMMWAAIASAGLAYLPVAAHQGTGQRGGPGASGTGDVNAANLAAAIAALPADPLSDAEREGILYVREEEKLAHDVYTVLYEKWGLQIFANIAASESTHMAAMALLIDRYGLEDPVSDKPGVFTNPELQKLYDDLVAKGTKSLIDALEVGAIIEEVDIVDIQEYLKDVDNEDIELVYKNLLKGSRNHLRAFVSTLERYGVEYKPQFLSPEEYEKIVTSPTEQGNAGGG